MLVGSVQSGCATRGPEGLFVTFLIPRACLIRVPPESRGNLVMETVLTGTDREDRVAPSIEGLGTTEEPGSISLCE